MDLQNETLQKYLVCQGAELYCVLLLQSNKIILYVVICTYIASFADFSIPLDFANAHYVNEVFTFDFIMHCHCNI